MQTDNKRDEWRRRERPWIEEKEEKQGMHFPIRRTRVEHVVTYLKVESKAQGQKAWYAFPAKTHIRSARIDFLESTKQRQ